MANKKDVLNFRNSPRADEGEREGDGNRSEPAISGRGDPKLTLMYTCGYIQGLLLKSCSRSIHLFTVITRYLNKMYVDLQKQLQNRRNEFT